MRVNCLGKSAGKYRLVRMLGEGGMGSVYLAEYSEIESQAAVKVLHAEFTKDREVLGRFMDEARAVNRVKHPALVRVHDCEMESEIGAYLVMEYVEGLALRDEQLRLGRLPVERAVRLTRQIASALAAVHQKGIIHRDLKPENILLVEDPDMVGGAGQDPGFRHRQAHGRQVGHEPPHPHRPGDGYTAVHVP